MRASIAPQLRKPQGEQERFGVYALVLFGYAIATGLAVDPMHGWHANASLGFDARVGQRVRLYIEGGAEVVHLRGVAGVTAGGSYESYDYALYKLHGVFRAGLSFDIGS